jgi:hypothetical protein
VAGPRLLGRAYHRRRWTACPGEPGQGQPAAAPDHGGPGRRTAAWEWRERALWALDTPQRRRLVWDNLKGHYTPERLDWSAARGVWPLFTPLGGSWLNLAESVQRLVVRRALAGQRPRIQESTMTWLREAMAGWNEHPTPFVWSGLRAARRLRAPDRRPAVARSGGCTRRPRPQVCRPRDQPPPNS